MIIRYRLQLVNTHPVTAAGSGTINFELNTDPPSPLNIKVHYLLLKRAHLKGEQHQTLTAFHTAQHFCYSALPKAVKRQLLEKRDLTCLCHTRSCNLPRRHPHRGFRLMDHSFENTARDKGSYQHETVVCEGVGIGMGQEDFSCHFLSFLPCSCSEQECNSGQVARQHPTQHSARPGTRRCTPRTGSPSAGARHPRAQQLIHFAASITHHTGSPSPDRLGTLLFACSSCEPAAFPPKGSALLLPSRWLYHGLRVAGEAPLLPLRHVASP